MAAGKEDALSKVDEQAPLSALDLLEEAKAMIAQSGDTFILKHKTDALLAKLVVLESQADVGSALARARAIASPFYSSLALSGVAASGIPGDSAQSAEY